MRIRRIFLNQALLALFLSGVVIWGFFSFVATRTVRGYDIFWHLASGRVTHELGQLTRVDPFCFTTGDLTWTNINWLAQLIFYRIFLVNGFASAINAATILFAIVIVCYLIQNSRRGSWALITLALLPFLVYALWVTTSVRPRMFSFAFLAITTLLLSSPDEDDRFSYLHVLILIPLFWIWNNSHGGVIYGYGLIGLDAAGTALARAWKHRSILPRAWMCRRIWLLSVVVVLGACGFLFLHPLGLDAVKYILGYRDRMIPEVYRNTIELLPLGFHTSYGQALAVYMVLSGIALGAGVLGKKKIRLREAIPCLVFLLATFKIQRFIPAFMIVSLPLICSLWTQLFAESESKFAKYAARVELYLAPSPICLAASLSLLLFIWTTYYVPTRHRGATPGSVSSWLIPAERYPIAATEYLKAHPTPPRVFTEYHHGGILNWALYPDQRTFIDGRGDFHSTGNTFLHYLTILNRKPGWEQLVDQYDIGFFLLPREHPLLSELESRGWSNVSDDGTFRLLERAQGSDNSFVNREPGDDATEAKK